MSKYMWSDYFYQPNTVKPQGEVFVHIQQRRYNWCPALFIFKCAGAMLAICFWCVSLAAYAYHYERGIDLPICILAGKRTRTFFKLWNYKTISNCIYKDDPISSLCSPLSGDNSLPSRSNSRTQSWSNSWGTTSGAAPSVAAQRSTHDLLR